MVSRRRQVLVLVGGAAVFVLGARAARQRAVSPQELRLFRAFNDLPATGFKAAWLLMQLGSLGGVLALALGSAVTGRPGLARQLVTRGTLTWVAAKVAKRTVRRARPAGAGTPTRVLGNEQVGLGYPSGHAAVAATLYALLEPSLPNRWRAPAATATAAVGVTRIYVGAHLPLDVIGGFALGAVLGAGSQLVTRDAQEPMSVPSCSMSSWRSSRLANSPTDCWSSSIRAMWGPRSKSKL